MSLSSSSSSSSSLSATASPATSEPEAFVDFAHPVFRGVEKALAPMVHATILPMRLQVLEAGRRVSDDCAITNITRATTNFDAEWDDALRAVDQWVLLYGEEILDEKIVGTRRVENPDYPGVIEYIRAVDAATAV